MRAIGVAGNRGGLPHDSLTVRCKDFRDAITARLDGGALPDELGDTGAHLRGCADRRRFEVRAARVSRLVRVRLVADEPDGGLAPSARRSAA